MLNGFERVSEVATICECHAKCSPNDGDDLNLFILWNFNFYNCKLNKRAVWERREEFVATASLQNKRETTRVSGRMWIFISCIPKVFIQIPERRSNPQQHELLPNNPTIKLNFSRVLHIKVNILVPRKVIPTISMDMWTSRWEASRTRWNWFIYCICRNSSRSHFGFNVNGPGCKNNKTTKLFGKCSSST